MVSQWCVIYQSRIVNRWRFWNSTSTNLTNVFTLVLQRKAALFVTKQLHKQLWDCRQPINCLVHALNKCRVHNDNLCLRKQLTEHVLGKAQSCHLLHCLLLGFVLQNEQYNQLLCQICPSWAFGIVILSMTGQCWGGGGGTILKTSSAQNMAVKP